MATFNNGKNVEFIVNYPERKAPRVVDEETLKRLASMGKYYTILHDEFSEHEKEDETIHRHLVIVSPNGYASATWVNMVATAFNVPNVCVQVMAIKNLKKRIRYLCHRNQEDKDKFQFPLDRVQTNDRRNFAVYMEDKPEITVDLLASYGGDWAKFGADFGIALAHKYKSDIKELGNVKDLQEAKLREFQYLRDENDSLREELRNVKGNLVGRMRREIEKIWPLELRTPSLKRDIECLEAVLRDFWEE